MVVDYRAETAWLDSILQPGQQHPEGAQGEEDHDDMLDDDDDDDLQAPGRRSYFARAFSSESVAYASAIRANFASASGSLFTSGWLRSASRR